MMKIDGATSVGLPGVQGKAGVRSRVFFYGNSKVSDDTHRKIYFGTTQADVKTQTKYAIITDEFEPEEYDYIMYTTRTYDYILLIKSVKKPDDKDYYECIVQKLDSIKLNTSSSQITEQVTNTETKDVELSFTVTRSKKSVNITKRNAFSYDYKTISDTIILTPDVSTGVVVDSEMINFALTTGSEYKLDAGTRIVVDFIESPSMQSFIMDTMLSDKYSDSSALMNTYRGDHNRYSIIKKNSNGEWVQENVDFDDEHLENFSIVLKDFDDSRPDFTATLITAPFKREGRMPKAYLFAYVKNGKFIDKYLLDSFDLSFVIPGTDSSITSYYYSSNEGAQQEDADNDQIIPDSDAEIPDMLRKVWTCNCCGATGNTGHYCEACGNEEGTCLPAGEDDDIWTCHCCGTSGNTGERCRMCGSLKDSCGEGQTGPEGIEYWAIEKDFKVS